MVQGKGGKIGPDLSGVGKRREADWLSKFLKDPKGTVAGAMMLPVKGSEEEISALVAYLKSLTGGNP
jgi:cbb3-type cytochrome oxidase cytochrome c subunit